MAHLHLFLSFTLWILVAITNAFVISKRAVPDTWFFKGCYLDDGASRSLQGAFYQSGDSMTNEACIEYCGSKGYNLAGTEYAAECYCDYIINVMRQDDGDCNMACNGDSSETCGGPNRLTVYQYNGTAPLGPVENPGFEGWMSIGCYTDGAAARTLTHQAAVDGGAGEMSVRACTTACDNAGYKFAGVEYGQECWCDDSIQNDGEPVASGCNMACAGNMTELCGGPNRLNIYESGVIADPTGGTSTVPSSTAQPTPSNTTTMTPPSTTTPTSTPTATGLPDGWEYQGCWIDNVNGRIFGHQEADNPDMTIESCIGICSDLGYTVAGMEWSVQCFCDNFVRNGGEETDESMCNMACGGNSEELCGAGNILSVYSTGELTVYQPPTAQEDDLPGNWQYIGCLADDSTAAVRTLPNQLILANNNSASTCLKMCSDYGYNAGGMEYGSECYCGDVGDVQAAGATLQEASDCNMACSGDPSYLCGGPNRISYYNWIGSGVAQFEFPQGESAGLYEFLIGGLVVPLMSTQTITKKIEFLEKFGETDNSTGAYELDVSLVDDFDAAWRTLHVKTDIFCAAMLTLPDKAGRILNVGGWSLDSLEGVRLLTPSGSPGVRGTTDWEENVDVLSLQIGRWYPGMVEMANGSILVVGGEDGSNGPPVPSLEILPRPVGGYLKDLPYLERTDPLNLYPFLAVLPSGNIFMQYYNEAIIIDEETLDIIKQLPNVPGSVSSAEGGRNYPWEGSMMIMPQRAPYTDPLEILICGGSTPAPNAGIDNCVSIQPEAADPQWVIERMPSRRVMSCMTGLPDGTFLITNGAEQGQAGFGLATQPNTNAVLYDPTLPVNQRMSVLANSTIYRLYHSESILLSDGRVLVSGSDPEDTRFPQEYRIETFSPPYMFSEIPAPEFTIEDIDWDYGETVTINITSHTSPIGDLVVSLLAADTSTHGSTMGQRTYFPATSCSGTTCTVTAPPDAKICPASWFQLFVIDGGRPSESTYVRVGGDPANIGSWPDYEDFTPPGTGPITT